MRYSYGKFWRPPLLVLIFVYFYFLLWTFERVLISNSPKLRILGSSLALGDLLEHHSGNARASYFVTSED